MSGAPLSPDPASRRFSAVAILLHWAIAALIVTNVLVAWRFQGLKGLAQFELIQLHKSIGISVLVLSLLRLAWRLLHRPPPYPPTMAPWEKAAASTVHWAFYGFMILMPLTGWLMVSASPFNLPTLLWGAIPLPHIEPVHALPMGERRVLTERFEGAHEMLAWTAYLLIAVHVAAAIKHQFFNKDGVLWRMAPLPGLKARSAASEESS